MTLDAHRLLVLRAVHRTGSVAGAAASLHLTVSGVSQHLTRLELEARLALLDRSRRGGARSVRLTPAGVVPAQRADDVALALADAQREADRLREGSTGLVRVGGSRRLGHLVVPALTRLAISDPALQVEVAAGLGAAVVPRPSLSHLDTTGVVVHPTATEVGARVVTLSGPGHDRRATSTARVRDMLRANHQTT